MPMAPRMSDNARDEEEEDASRKGEESFVPSKRWQEVPGTSSAAAGRGERVLDDPIVLGTGR